MARELRMEELSIVADPRRDKDIGGSWRGDPEISVSLNPLRNMCLLLTPFTILPLRMDVMGTIEDPCSPAERDLLSAPTSCREPSSVRNFVPFLIGSPTLQSRHIGTGNALAFAVQAAMTLIVARCRERGFAFITISTS
jgi:hypothetical protein